MKTAKEFIYPAVFTAMLIGAQLVLSGVAGVEIVTVLLLAFTMNILLVLFRKYTKIRTLFITGHVMVQQSSTALWLVKPS